MKKCKKESDAERMRSEEEVIFEKVLQEHPKYSEELEDWDWNRVYDPDTEVNPYMHLEIHKTIEKQLSTNTPPEVRQTLDRLMKSGLSRHESIHKIGTALVGEIYDILRNKKRYNKERYINRLKKLR
jgi:hypothetical protein